MSQAATASSGSGRLIGRSFVNPIFDYLVIGGGISLVVTFIIWQHQEWSQGPGSWGPFVFLVANMAHFAASTVRLYSKRGSIQALPFLTMAFPLVCLGVILICLTWPMTAGKQLQSLYLTWSPYHYAAQAYGLAVMYAYRSGCMLTKSDKRLLFWLAMIPFFRMTLCVSGKVMGAYVGVQWVASESMFDLLQPWQGMLDQVLLVAACAAPVILLVKTWSSSSGPLPLISLLMLITNSVWFFALDPMNAFVWATIFHSIQYLGIVIIFHVRDKMSEPDNRRGVLYHVLWFYGACVLLGYGLFSCMPLAFAFTGFGVDESAWVMVAAINLHHFIVDGYIWRLKKTDSNRKIVDAGEPAAASSS